MARSLEDRVALVTGAGRGIGRTIALRLASEGMRVGLLGRTEADLRIVGEQIRSHGGQAVVAAVDVTDSAAVAGTLIELSRTLGPADVLVNNAGVYGTPGTQLLEYDPDAWWRVVEVNVRGPMLLTHAVLPEMIRRGSACVINIGSYAAIRPAPGSTAYAASKAALCRLTDSLAAELSGSGVTAFAVSPGFVRTEMSARLPGVEHYSEDRWDHPETVAALIVRIARGDADALSGSFIHVRDDLDALLAHADEIQRAQLFRLGLPKLNGQVERPAPAPQPSARPGPGEPGTPGATR